MKKLFTAIILCAVVLCGCTARPGGVSRGETSSPDASGSDDAPQSLPAESGAEESADFAKGDSEMFTDRDGRPDYDANSAVTISLADGTAYSSSSSVKIDGGTVTITEDGVYVISGALEDGRIVVDAPDMAKPQLVLNGVSVTSRGDAALHVLNADKVFVTLASQTENTLANAEGFEGSSYDGTDGAVFSKSDLTFNGSGSLAVVSPQGHGIVGKDDLVFTGGTFDIQSASHGCDANDSVRIGAAKLKIASGKDGIHADNADDASKGFVYLSGCTLDVTAEGDGVSASAYLQVQSGDFKVVSGGGSANASKDHSDNWGGFPGGFGPGGGGQAEGGTDDDSASIKGLKASGSLLINGGAFDLNCADDAIHSNTSITINGGTFEIAAGDDGVHADESLLVSGGSLNISESYEGLEALELTVSGGDVRLKASDDGLNAAGGADQSGFGGPRGGDRFGGGRGPGGVPGGQGVGASGGSITICGGTIYIEASGDGIDANGTLSITGGETTVCGPTQGDTATLDYDVSGTITGGSFIGTGAAGMAQGLSSSSQGVIFVRIRGIAAGTSLELADADGRTILSACPALPYEAVILSSPELVKGQTYKLTVGSDTQTVTAG